MDTIRFGDWFCDGVICISDNVVGTLTAIGLILEVGLLLQRMEI